MAADIRRACDGDADRLYGIEKASFRSDLLSPRSLHRLIASPSAAVMVAEVGASIAGYCVVLFRENSLSARLYSIAVEPAHAGLGIGRTLLAAAEREALARARASLRLEVRTDNERAIALYRQSGFREIGKRPDYYQDGATALRMEKPLSCRSSVAEKTLRRPHS